MTTCSGPIGNFLKMEEFCKNLSFPVLDFLAHGQQHSHIKKSESKQKKMGPGIPEGESPQTSPSSTAWFYQRQWRSRQAKEAIETILSSQRQTWGRHLFCEIPMHAVSLSLSLTHTHTHTHDLHTFLPLLSPSSASLGLSL